MVRIVYILFLCFIYKLGSSQSTTALKFSSTGTDWIESITTDSIGNFYILGKFSGTLTIDSAGSSKTFTTSNSQATFIMKYNCSNSFQWAFIIDNTTRNTVFGCLKYRYGFLYAVTNLVSSSTLTSANGNSFSVSTQGSYAGILLKLNTNGNYVYHNIIESSGGKVELNDVEMSLNKDIYVTGAYQGTASIKGQNSTTKTTSSSLGSIDAVYMKFDKSGQIIWAKTGGGAGDDVSCYICLDSKDNLYMTHQYSCCSSNNATFGSYTLTNITQWGIIFTKIDTSDGSIIWLTNSPGSATVAGGIVRDEEDNLYFTCGFESSKTIKSFSSGVNKNISSNGGFDIYIAKYNSSGNILWLKTYGSSADEWSWRSTYKDGKIYANVAYGASFSITSGANTFNFNSAGGTDDAIIAFDTAGNCVDGKTINGSGGQRSFCFDYSVTGKLIIGGIFTGTITSGGQSITSSAGQDGYLYIFDTATTRLISNRVNNICTSESIKISTGLTSGTFKWSPGVGLDDSTIASPTATTTINRKHILKYTSVSGCIYYDTATVNVSVCSECPTGSKPTGSELVINGSFTSGNSGFNAGAYTYSSGHTPSNPLTNDYYDVVNDASSIHFAYTGIDHTNGSGKFLAINGSTAAANCWIETLTVQPYTNYYISGWFNNIADPVNYPGLPIACVDFRVNDTIISSKLCLNDYPDSWLQLDTLWNSGPRTSIKLSVYNYGTSGNGNDFGIDDITMKLCNCSGSQISYTAGPDTTLCAGNSYTLPIPSGSKWKYRILNGDTSGLQGTNTANPSFSTTYLFIDSSGTCNAYDTITVKVVAKPSGGLGASKNLCRGDSVQLVTASSFSYEWSPSSGLSDSTIYNPYAKPTLSTDYKVKVTANGCSYFDSVTIVVYSTPSSSRVSQYICALDSFQLQANGFASTYSWSPSTALSNPNISNPKASPASNLTYICLKNTTNNCKGYDTVSIQVDYVTPNAGPDTIMCAGANVQLQASGGATYSWSPTTGLNNSNIDNPLASPPSNITYIVSVTGIYGCVKTDTLNIIVKNIIIDAGPDVVICGGDSTQLLVTGGDSYIWTPNTGLSSDTAYNPIAKPLITTTYIVTGITNNGCTRNDTIIVFVGNTSVDAGPDAIVCGADSVQLQASIGVLFSWTPTTGLSDPSIRNPKALPSSNTVYYVTITDSSGCTGADSVTLVISPKADAIVPILTYDICEGDSVTLSVSGLGGYIWSNGITDSSITVAPLVTTKYFVYADIPGYCRSDTAFIDVIVHKKPNVNFTADPLSGTRPLTVNFNNKTTNATSYFWDFGTGEKDSIKSPVYIFQTKGLYKVKLKAVSSFGCTDSFTVDILVRDSFYFFIPTSFTPNNNKKNDLLVIDFDPENVIEGYMYIYNRWGEKVYEADLLHYIPWDGTYRDKQVQEDVYLMILQITDKNREEHLYNNTLTILR